MIYISYYSSIFSYARKKTVEICEKAEETTDFFKRKLYLLEVMLCALSSRFFFLQVHSAVYAFIVDSVKEGAAELF